MLIQEVAAGASSPGGGSASGGDDDDYHVDALPDDYDAEDDGGLLLEKWEKRTAEVAKKKKEAAAAAAAAGGSGKPTSKSKKPSSPPAATAAAPLKTSGSAGDAAAGPNSKDLMGGNAVVISAKGAKVRSGIDIKSELVTALAKGDIVAPTAHTKDRDGNRRVRVSVVSCAANAAAVGEVGWATFIGKNGVGTSLLALKTLFALKLTGRTE